MSEKKIIKNALIVDPESYKQFYGNIIIKDDYIEEINSDIIPEFADGYEIYDAKGNILAPGIIDIHAHTDGYYFCGEKELAQGVTTVVCGNCGISPAGITTKDFYDLQEQKGFNINQTTFTGHSFTLREKAGATDCYAPASQSQIELMKKLALQDLKDGACGISFGIQYAPGTTTDEFNQVAKVSADFGRPVSVHTRLNFPNDWESLKETLDIAKNTGAHVIVSHLSYMFADGQMDRCLEMIADYRAKGYLISADSGMYTAFSTMAGSACYDEDQIKANHWDYSQFVAANGIFCGQHLDKQKFEYMRANEPNNGIICFTGVEEDIYKALCFTDVMVSSDCGKALPGQGHPQDAAVFARFFRIMVREKKLLSLIEAVRRCTYLPARTIGIKDRGRICKGAKADLFVFNPDTIKDNADFPGIGNPDLPPDGIEFVFVNGECAIKNGKRVESCNAGKILRFN